jgi:hypothetical protein
MDSAQQQPNDYDLRAQLSAFELLKAEHAELLACNKTGAERLQFVLRENARLQTFADAVREIALKPIDASDAMDELDTLLGSSWFSSNENAQLRDTLNEWANLTDDGLRLRCGELTAQEIRTVRAVLRALNK